MKLKLILPILKKLLNNKMLGVQKNIIQSNQDLKQHINTSCKWYINSYQNILIYNKAIKLIERKVLKCEHISHMTIKGIQ